MHSQMIGDKWMNSHINHDLTSLLIQQVYKIVSPATSLPALPPSTWSTKSTAAGTTLPSLYNFIEIIVRQSHTRIGTLMVALILLTRLSCRLGHVTKGTESSPQRIFLASLIISTKITHDTSPKNKHWMTFSNHYFELDEINLMEKQFLTLMDFNLLITDYDFYQAVDCYRQMERDKKRWWQETPQCLISPSKNVAFSLGKNTTVTKRSLPLLSPSPTLSTPSTPAYESSPSTLSDSPLLVISLSCTPVNDSSFNINPSAGTLDPIASKDDRDHTRLHLCHFTSCLSPLSSA